MLLGPLGQGSRFSFFFCTICARGSGRWCLVDAIDGSLDTPEALCINTSVRLMVADAAEIAFGTDAVWVVRDEGGGQE